jgi:hypothetical protein
MIMRAGYIQSIFTLALSAVRVHRGDRQALVVDEVIDGVALELGVGEDEDAARLLREDEVEQRLVLLALGDIDDLLLDVLVGAANAADPVVVSVRAQNPKSGIAEFRRLMGCPGGIHRAFRLT